MRIISGTLKGKSIYFIRNFHTRPLKDSVRENIFNILKHSNLINISIQKANILDLYSGVDLLVLNVSPEVLKKLHLLKMIKMQ